MLVNRVSSLALLVAGSILGPHSAQAHGDRPHAGPVGETVTVIADKAIPHVPGKRLVSNIVDYAPGGRSVSHRHAASAFIYAYVLSGAVRSQVDDEPVRVYRTGEAWFENPGAHHRVSANASDTAPARLLAVFIVDAGDDALTTPDGD
jgi:quercetin dioxygenase-like cupin family protein